MSFLILCSWRWPGRCQISAVGSEELSRCDAGSVGCSGPDKQKVSLGRTYLRSRYQTLKNHFFTWLLKCNEQDFSTFITLMPCLI